MVLLRVLDRAGIFNREPSRIDILCHNYLLKKENEENAQTEIERLKSQILIHRPEAYEELIKEGDQSEEVIQTTPKTEAEFQSMIRKMQQLGMPVLG